MQRILVVAPSWVGDCVMAQPLLARLHARNPGAVIDVLAPPFTAALFRRMPEVAGVIDNPFAHGELRLGERYRLGRRLARAGYRQAVLLPNTLKSALAPFFARIPRRTGFVGEGRYGLLNDARRLDKARYPLMVERFALLAERPGAELERPVPEPRLTVGAAARQATLARLELDAAGQVAVFCPGAEYGPAKRWPAVHFAALGRRLAAQGYRLWLVGSAKDAPVAREIAAACDAVDLTGRTGLDEAIDVLSLAALVISNDSGLMHVAAALDRPMVAIFGSSSPGFTPPLSRRARVATLNLTCSPCFQRECPLGHLACLRDLTPEHLAAEIGRLEISA
ncbi:MAG: lipopolysaccharide heptosyltransferase II [Pseudomonadota bacterium]